MDMDMPPPDPTIVNLPLSDPRCNVSDCLAFAAAAAESQAKIPWADGFKYGRWATYYYLAITGLFILSYAYHKYQDRKATVSRLSDAQAPGLRQKLLAVGRWLAYRRIEFPGSSVFEIPSFGVVSLLLATVVFLAALTFAARPYYRKHVHYGSPPIATRTGLMAYACTPILIALAGKANVITLITGISHEKLNVIHRWVGWFTLVLSLVHTIPFFYQPGQDHGYTTLNAEWSVRMGGDMYSGVPPLAMLVGLVFLSIQPIRQWVYETFYFSHVLMAITYLGLLFWHAANLGDSWAYLWATLALWLASWLARLFWYTRPMNIRNEWFQGATTLLTHLPGGMTKIEVLNPPDGFTWTPSQHCFLRFPRISLLDNHPFTIVSGPLPAPSRRNNVKQRGEKVGDVFQIPHKQVPLTFLARTHSGFTRRLDSFSAKHADNALEVWIDGPYGGLGRPIERLYDHLVLVAGGSGITVCLPWLTSIMAAEPSEIRVERISLVWAVKHQEHLDWARDWLTGVKEKLAQRVEGSRLEINSRFYVTQEAIEEKPITTTHLQDSKSRPMPQSKEIDDEIHKSPSPSSTIDDPTTATTNQNTSPSATQQLSSTPIFEPLDLHSGRPDMATIVRDEIARSASNNKKLFFVGCGPGSMRNELGNAVARAQTGVMKGDVAEVALHLEAFGW
ncbi:uncharacterized protein A1O9_10912 [Exophiala aquamarina CBS 119918]|uniref:FAD-binding FR-type domain-containing protein n=1 Tax=Exophiala aquamarina CBS 119918 TaxID=1182545 RepID=A0A072NYQ5_9EURO|nr:uncharacterized protein A1O9_10912 [Exophiala aquamarina CBS 119918]KEF53004.1 hypothetical protein A1O9_10912 [Exophiala aquamarina CBS 119918]